MTILILAIDKKFLSLKINMFAFFIKVHFIFQIPNNDRVSENNNVEA